MRRALLAILGLALSATNTAGAMPGPDVPPAVRELALVPHLLENGEPWETNFMAFEGNIAVASAGFDWGTELGGDETSRSKGFGIFRLLDKKPYMKQIGAYSCPAGIQTDIAIWGDYVFQSTNPSQVQSPVCNSEAPGSQDDTVGKAGVRIVDISNPRRPRQVHFVEMRCRGSVFTLAPRGRFVYVYWMRENDCNIRTGASSFRMTIMRFDPRNPTRAKVVSEPSLGDGDGQIEAGDQDGCSEIVYFGPRRLLTCLAFNRFSLYDMKDPMNPRHLSTTLVPGMVNTAMAGFSWDGQVLVLNDQGEAGGFGSQCATDASVPDLYFYNIEDPTSPAQLGTYAQTRTAIAATERRFPFCQMWDFSIVPTRAPGRHVLVGGTLSGGFTMVDFSNPSSAKEIAWYCECDANGLSSSDTSHAYWYNGRFYAPEMQTMKGIRVLEVEGFNRSTVHWFETRYNSQTQVTEFWSDRSQRLPR